MLQQREQLASNYCDSQGSLYLNRQAEWYADDTLLCLATPQVLASQIVCKQVEIMQQTPGANGALCAAYDRVGKSQKPCADGPKNRGFGSVRFCAKTAVFGSVR
jgi:hypothetical protein